MELQDLIEQFPVIEQELSKSGDCKKNDYNNGEVTRLKRNVKFKKLVLSSPHYVGDAFFKGISWIVDGTESAYFIINVEDDKEAIESFCDKYQDLTVSLSNVKTDLKIRSYRGIELIYKGRF